MRLAGVSVDGLDAKAKNFALVDQPLNSRLRWPRSVWAIFAHIHEILRHFALRPVGPEKQPCSLRNTAMLYLPSLQMLNRKQPIRVRSSLGRAIHNRRWCHEYTGIYCVHCIVRIVFTSHPMDRSIEMCTRVFTTGEVVPVPSGPFLVVATDSFLLEGPHLTELWRQLERREVG